MDCKYLLTFGVYLFHMKKIKKKSLKDRHPLKTKLCGSADLRVNPAFNYVMLTLAGACIGLLSLLLASTVFGLSMFWSYFSSPLVILLNLLPPILLLFLLYFISGRSWLAFSLSMLITMVFSLIHYFKVQIRGDPFILSDIMLVREVNKILAPYTLTMNWKVYLVIVAFLAGTAFSVFLLKHKPQKNVFRIVSSVIVVAVSAVLYMTVYADSGIYSNTIGGFSVHEWSDTHTYISKGFVYPFIHSIKYSLADILGDTPDWYNAQEAEQIAQSYVDDDIPEGKKVNIIAITLESYADLSVFDCIDFNEDVYGPLHRLQKQSFSGKLVTNTFSGGTIDAERLFLTGNTRLTHFASTTNSFVHYLKSQGYHTEGLHAGDMWFYDRRPINAFLGFENYYFLEDFENSNRYDWFFFPKVSDLYNERDINKPYFSYNLSYQNHGPYDDSKTSEPYLLERNGMSDESFNILNNYIKGVRDTTNRLESFIDMLRYDSAPVVVVIFGDHMPWLGNMSSVYTELGMNIDRNTEEGFFNYYSTPYLIWANDPAKVLLGNDFIGDGGSFSPCFLIGELFRLCSWEGDGYMQALRELKQHIDIINTQWGLYRENGVLTSTLSPDSEASFRRLRMFEIYRRGNFSY